MNDINPTFDFTSPTEIADALEAVIQRLRALPDNAEIPATHVNLEIWINGGANRANEAVDLLGYAVTGHTGEPAELSAHHDIYSTPRPSHLTGLGTRVLTVKRRRKTRRVSQVAIATGSNATVVQVAGRTY